MNADQTDSLTQRVLGAVFEVSNTLGAGFLEKVYRRALLRELGLRGIRAAGDANRGGVGRRGSLWDCGFQRKTSAGWRLPVNMPAVSGVSREESRANRVSGCPPQPLPLAVTCGNVHYQAPCIVQFPRSFQT